MILAHTGHWQKISDYMFSTSPEAKNRSRLAVITMFFGITASLVVLGLSAHRAFALGTVYFDPADVSPSVATHPIVLVAGKSVFAQTVNSHVRAYYTKNKGNVIIEDKGYCPGNDYDYTDGVSGTPSNSQIGQNATQFVINGTTYYGTFEGWYCNGSNLTLSLSSLPYDSGAKLYYIDINATGIMNYAKNGFRVKAPGSVAVAQVGDSSGNTVSIRPKGNYTPAGNFNYNIKFGSDCSVVATTRQTLYFYDMDNAGGAGAQPSSEGDVTVQLFETLPAGSETQVPLYKGASTYMTYTPPSIDNTTTTVDFDAHPGAKYRIRVNNVYYNNIIQASTPFDGIYYLQPCAPPVIIPPVKTTPFFSALGGDVAAGTGFKTPLAGCVVPGAASIKAHNVGSVGGFAGAGTTAAAWVTGGSSSTITDFVSGLGLSGGAAPTGAALSFANATGGGTYGTGFGNTIPCNTDYYGEITGVSPRSWGGWPLALSGAYSSGSVNLGANILAPGQQISLYVHGNVYITGDISYTGIPSSIGDISRFNLYVSGNIIIGSNVHNLTGVYVAQKDSTTGTGGNIVTCSTKTSDRDITPASISVDFNSCNSQLIVQGSMNSESALYMDRTYGSNDSAGGAPNAPSETFQYSPQVWLNGKASPGEIESYKNLPPVL